MSTKIRECIKGLNKNKDVEQLLPEYLKQSMQLHDKYARLKLMMEYYIFYETVSEGINPYIDSAKDTADALHQVIYAVFREPQNCTEEKRAELKTMLQALRQEVIDKMQVLTAYVDQFVVYEYILNRIQYRYEEKEEIEDDASFAQKVLNFIFASQDNMAISDNIRAVLGQLPMRMAGVRYYDLVQESISVYKGSDQSALDGYLYMFRTNAMLYSTPAMDKYFMEFAPVLHELSGLDYDTLGEEGYRIYAEKIRVNASKLNDISDLYMLLQQLINEVYSVVLAWGYGPVEDAKQPQNKVICGINALFLQQDWEEWKDAPEEPEERLAWLGEHFHLIEGQQEHLYEAINMADAVLEETCDAQKDTIEKLGLTQSYRELNYEMQLSSNSLFIELTDQSEEQKVTPQQAEEAASTLIAELKASFRGHSRMLRRAVMANTLEKMPVFFTTPQEVADYISHSLAQCSDEAEKYASKQLILEMIENDH